MTPLRRSAAGIRLQPSSSPSESMGTPIALVNTAVLSQPSSLAANAECRRTRNPGCSCQPAKQDTHRRHGKRRRTEVAVTSARPWPRPADFMAPHSDGRHGRAQHADRQMGQIMRHVVLIMR